MSCNGCRVLRKGCSEGCALRASINWIDGAEAQGNATLFAAKFFGRTGLMNFITATDHSHRPDLFRSLLYEACGRTVNPVSGAVGLLSSGKWDLCEAAVETVLQGGAPKPISSEFDLSRLGGSLEKSDTTCSEIDGGGDRVPPRLLNLFV